jgi:nicotinamidase-related amidase
MVEYLVPHRDGAALLTVGVQNDYTSARSPVCTPGANRAVPNIAKLAAAFREAGRPIFHAIRLYRPDGTNVDLCRRNAVEEGARYLMPGTKGAELSEEVHPNPAMRSDPAALLSGEFIQLGEKEWLFYKPRWGAFHGTDIEARLKDLGIDTLVVCGCNFPTATRATLYEASARDLRTVMAPDAVTDLRDDALSDMARMGVYLMETGACLEWLKGKAAKNAA